MADWVLIPCLKALFAEFDRIAPSRDHASDGSIGDDAHEAETSDHNPDEVGSVPIHDADKVNEVHAIDVDNNLRESDLTMEKVVQFLLGRCRSGAEKRLRYIIYNRRIWSASTGWVQKTYTGASPHTEHAHFSASYTTSLEASTVSWHLEDIPVALTQTDKDWIVSTIVAQLRAGYVAQGLRQQPHNLSDLAMTENFKTALETKYGNPQVASRVYRQHVNDLQQLRDVLMDINLAGRIPLDPASGLGRLLRAADLVLASTGEGDPS